ncbi:Hypothetical protein mma_3164 [Janthinobacterium sp. Marseille]|nr:hypothetical protein [Janthinobacterium sp. Marseille]ABR91854.1 Hypothetical protein mma_3164 [Janthinobacterium sp. Marseille]
MKIEQQSEVARNKPWQIVVAALILGGAFMYYPLSKFFNFSISFSDNALEQSLHVGKSTKDQFKDFMDEGGLPYESSWKGYHVEKADVRYHENDKLAIAEILLEKKPIRGKMASVANLKSSLSSECGSDWSASPNANLTMYQATKNGIECAMQDNGDQAAVVLIKRQP